jgi:ATP-binding cassette subfamily F protein uup
MSLISLQNITLSFGGLPILQQINLQIEPGERVCLIGRNGEGKSSLMKLIVGGLKPDGGNIIRQQGLRVARLSQNVPLDLNGSVFEVVAGGLGELQIFLTQYHDTSVRLSSGGGENLLTEMETVQHQLETAGGWQAKQRVETVISRLQLNADSNFSELSGGMKRRVLLARASSHKTGQVLGRGGLSLHECRLATSHRMGKQRRAKPGNSTLSRWA